MDRTKMLLSEYTKILGGGLYRQNDVAAARGPERKPAWSGRQSADDIFVQVLHAFQALADS